MGLVADVASIIPSEFNRFLNGISALSPDAQAAAYRKMWEAQAKRGQPNIIRIPRWDDVIHIRPRTTLTRSDYLAHFRALRAGRPSPLSPARQAEMQRRIAIKNAIQFSPLPPFQRAAAQIMTAIDNVQDLAATVSILGRMVLRAARFVLPKAAARLIPGLGLVITVSDLLNLLTFIGSMAVPTYAALCRGPAGLLAAGIPAALMGGALKAAVGVMARRSPRGGRGKLKFLRRIGKVLKPIAIPLVIGQVTDQVFGYGISLGGIVGALFGTTYAVQAKQRGEAVEIRSPAAAHRIVELRQDILAPLSRGELRERLRAANVLAQAPILLSHPETLGLDLYAETLLSTAAAVDIIASDFRRTGWQELIAEDEDIPLVAPAPAPSWDPGIVGLPEVDRATLGVWPVDPPTSQLPPDVVASMGGADIPAALMDVLADLEGTIESMFIGELVDRLAHAVYLFVEEDESVMDFELAPEWRLLESLAESNRLVNVGDPEDRIMAFFLEGTQKLQDGPRRTMVAEELDALASAHGLGLIRLVAPDLS